MEAATVVAPTPEPCAPSTVSSPAIESVLRVLTHSAMDAWGRCEVEYKLSYVERLTPTAYPAALAVGSAVHAGIEALHLGLPIGEACRSATVALGRYVERARGCLDDDGVRDIERRIEFDMARVQAMLTAWSDRYLAPADGTVPTSDRDLEILATEQVLEAPLVNPLSGRPSRSFRLAGRVDAVARLRSNGADGFYVVEFKTTGEDLDEFVEAMRFSAQPAIYQTLVEAQPERGRGMLLGSVIDVVRKPTIRPKKDETPEAFEERALEEYRREPTRFFRREMLAMNELLRRDAMVNAWRIADGIRRAEKYGYVSKRGPSCRGAYGPCRYRRLCWHGDSRGFDLKSTPHEELVG